MSEEARTDNAAEEAEEAGVATAALLTAAETAEALGISTRRLRDWRKEGRIAEVGRFKRGTARVPLFDPADVARLRAAVAAEEAPATTVATVPEAAAFAEAVARQVALLLAERSAAEVATVAPLVVLVREQQETIDTLRRRVEAAQQEADQARADQEAQAALRRRAELAEAELLATRARHAAAGAWGAATGADSTTEASAPPAPAAGLWARLGRWWRGAG